jgi:hypothetical protein
MLITRTNVSRAPCRRCHILRVLLLMVLGIVLVALVSRESFALISDIQPIMFGYLLLPETISYLFLTSPLLA